MFIGYVFHTAAFSPVLAYGQFLHRRLCLVLGTFEVVEQGSFTMALFAEISNPLMNRNPRSPPAQCMYGFE